MKQCHQYITSTTSQYHQSKNQQCAGTNPDPAGKKQWQTSQCIRCWNVSLAKPHALKRMVHWTILSLKKLKQHRMDIFHPAAGRRPPSETHGWPKSPGLQVRERTAVRFKPTAVSRERNESWINRTNSQANSLGQIQHEPFSLVKDRERERSPQRASCHW